MSVSGWSKSEAFCETATRNPPGRIRSATASPGSRHAVAVQDDDRDGLLCRAAERRDQRARDLIGRRPGHAARHLLGVEPDHLGAGRSPERPDHGAGMIRVGQVGG
jgi:hypothetical protein